MLLKSFIGTILIAITPAFPQTPFNYDTLKISFGYGTPDWQENPEDGLSYKNFYIFCGTRYIINTNIERDENSKRLLDSLNNNDTFVDKLPDEFIDKYLVDKPGDTLQIIDSAGISYAIIKEIDFFGGGECGRLGNQLERIDRKCKSSCMGNFIALRKPSFYSGQIYTYHKVDTISVSQQSIVTLIKTHHLSNWLKGLPEDYFDHRDTVTLEQAVNKNYCLVSIYKRDPLPLNDSFFVAIIPDHTLSGCNSTLYLAYVLNSTWKYKTILDHNPWNEIENVTCAFDLNNDGQLEYMIKESDELGFRESVIYTNLNNEWIRLTGGSAALGN